MDLDGDHLLVEHDAPLFAALDDGAEDTVQELLDSDISPNIHTAEGETLLHRAAHLGHASIAGLLLERGARTESVWKNLETPLHQAAKSGHVSVARALIKHGGADKDALTSRGETALYVAAGRGHVDMIRLLLEQGIKVDTPSREKWSPLHAACYYRHSAAVELLLQAGADVEWKLQPGGWTPLHKVAMRGFKDIAEILLKHGAKLDAQAKEGWTPLYVAARGGHVDTVRLFLEKDRPAKIDAQNTLQWSPLHAATYYRRKYVVEMLAETRRAFLEMRIKDGGWTALHMAASLGYSEIVEELLKHGADMDARAQKNNATPLYVAAREGHVNVLRVLMDRGADVDVRIKGRWTPLHAASYYGRRTALGFLLRAGAPREARMTDGWTALHKAAEAGFADIADLLLDHGANVDARDVSRDTPLHVATSYNRKDVVRLLLMRGADHEALNKKLLDPLGVATAKKHQECISMLEILQENPDHMWSDGDASFLTSGRESPEKWLNVIDLINSNITNQIQAAGDTAKPPVKIAVLDTGCSTEGAWFSTWTDEAARISNDHWHDFVGNELLPIDADGHGTAVVTTLLRTGRSTQVFVGRIAEKRSDLPNCAQNVADVSRPDFNAEPLRRLHTLLRSMYTVIPANHWEQAIDHAIEYWKVDIISMSFGFRTDQPLIRDAIATAMSSRKNKIIFFAAAGNRGANEEELYPASSQHVISVRATDHVGTFVGDYNPAPSSNLFGETTPLFGTLGVNVPYDYPSVKRMSGCSIATPIMTGLAALIMEYAAYHGAKELSQTFLRYSAGLSTFFLDRGVKQGNRRTYIHLETLLTQEAADWIDELDFIMKKLKQRM